MNRLYHIFTIAAAAILLGLGCSEDDTYHPVGGNANGNGSGESNEQGQGIPDGYFRVVFSVPESRAPITGSDNGRVRDVRYLLFKSTTGEFVKELHIVTPNDPAQTWPLSAICDTLPKGSYQAVFLCNTEKTLFPIPGTSTYTDVLTGYQNGYASGRIVLPPVEFSTGTEYYLANVTFSDAQPTPVINMQRIIGMLNVHRNFIDAQTALNKLTSNIFTSFHFKDNIKLQLQNTLPGLLRGVLDKGSDLANAIAYVGIVGGLDALVSTLTTALVVPLTDMIYNVVAAQLVNQLGIVLTGNADQNGLLGFLGVILNPWATSQADAAIVTINDFPKSVDFDLNVQSKFDGSHKFKFKFTGGSVYDEKDILIKGFQGQFDIRKINVVKTGLIAGLVIDDIADGPWLLNGTFIDINDPLLFSNQTNRRFKNNYSFLDLGLKSYDPQTQSPKPLSVTVNVISIPNLDGLVAGLPLLGGILSSLTNLVLNPIKTISVSVPVNFPLLGVENLKLSGGWAGSVAY